MIDLDNATVLMEAQRPALSVEGDPLEIQLRILTDTNENAIEVVVKDITNEEEGFYPFYIEIPGEYISVLLSMESLLGVSAEQPPDALGG